MPEPLSRKSGSDRCPRCLGSGKASDLHTTTVEAAARYEEFLGGHNYPRCGLCNGTGRVNA